jgi:6-phosphofructokinase 1
MNSRKIAVLTSGGDAPGMNAAIRAVYQCGQAMGFEVLGVERGFHGLIKGSFVSFSPQTMDDIVHRGGTVLKSARSEEFKTPDGLNKAWQKLKEADIYGLIVIGGDGSFRGAQTLEERGILTVGIPGTIDNDIPCTDFSIGFDTAVNTIVNAVNQLRDTALSHERIYVVEVMGRHSGWMALYSGIACGADAILLPELPADLSLVCDRLRQSILMKKTHSIVIVAEGVGGDPQARNTEQSSAFQVANFIGKELNNETRVTILGHLQRGGNPTVADRILASQLASRAVELIYEGQSGRMVGVQKGQVVDIPISEVLKHKRTLDERFIRLGELLGAI